MFYCEDCRREKDWPASFMTSKGKCEICDKVAICNDVPSSDLPKRVVNQPDLSELKELNDEETCPACGHTRKKSKIRFE